MTAANQRPNEAPGRPGIEPRWTSSAKTGVGAAAGTGSRVWFTVSHGILDEIYSPEVDRACTRDMGFIVTDGKDFFSDEKRDTKHTVEYLAPGVPAFRLTNECEAGRYKIEKEIIADPDLDVVLVRTKFSSDESLFLYTLLAPHLGNGGAHNDAWIDRIWGDTFCLAAHGSNALALGCSVPFLKCSAGFVGVSDGWQDLNQHKKMQWSYRMITEAFPTRSSAASASENAGGMKAARCVRVTWSRAKKKIPPAGGRGCSGKCSMAR